MVLDYSLHLVVAVLPFSFFFPTRVLMNPGNMGDTHWNWWEKRFIMVWIPYVIVQVIAY